MTAPTAVRPRAQAHSLLASLPLSSPVFAPLVRKMSAKILDLLAGVVGATPRVAKWLGIALLVVNAGGLPLIWHFRVFSALFELRLAQLWHNIRHIHLPRKRKTAALEKFFEDRQPVGLHPFRAKWAVRGFVWPYASDFNLHMSNSSYAAALDSARFRFALAMFPLVFKTGGWAALAGTHFSYIREIPMLSTYEVRAEVGAWDEKWIWIVARFVKPVFKSKRRGKAGEKAPITGHVVSANGNADAVGQELLKKAIRLQEEDGADVYTITVSQLVYKQGRITIPPAIVLATSGFFASAEHPARGTPGLGVPTNGIAMTRVPPPYWAQVQDLARDVKKLKAFYQGGWRDYPSEQRFWEHAFDACEAERQQRLVSFAGQAPAEGDYGSAGKLVVKGGLLGGMDGLKAYI
ncbi:unnamed protein product [Mycena citricolor]|uniref:Uncharacterized protein n=1 Tax=Mycena citricolor TaxID=2018698 RepID=A0AAD2GYI9_9AGAR|nr:unnamed protein product [Mycena citricolor]